MPILSVPASVLELDVRPEDHVGVTADLLAGLTRS
jgi:hypothetical protein